MLGRSDSCERVGTGSARPAIYHDQRGSLRATASYKSRSLPNARSRPQHQTPETRHQTPDTRHQNTRHHNLLTRQAGISTRAIHRKLSATKRRQIPSLDHRSGSSLIPYLQDISSFGERCCSWDLFVCPWIPYYSCGVPGQDVEWCCGGSHGIGVAVCGAGGDDG
jgi:hypothetical protein